MYKSVTVVCYISLMKLMQDVMKDVNFIEKPMGMAIQ